MDVQGEVNPERCFSCERYIGAADVCPYCGADSARSPLLRTLRGAALALATVGLLFLQWSARARDIPPIEIGAITPAMNFARVRIEGEVQRRAYRSPPQGVPDYLSFVVADESGEVRVQAWRTVAAELARSGRIPQRGDRVRVSGSLRVTARGEPRLALDAPGGLQKGDPSP